MIKTTQGNIFTANTQVIVNPVNTVGVLGKGLALQFKKNFPGLEAPYKEVCRSGELKTGTIHVWETGQFTPQYVVNFPTKAHWRNPSRISYVEDGLVQLRNFLVDQDITSIAIPPLGCGLGGLNWSDVHRITETALEGINTEVILYLP